MFLKSAAKHTQMTINMSSLKTLSNVFDPECFKREIDIY
jgi:hypothetical protein